MPRLLETDLEEGKKAAPPDFPALFGAAGSDNALLLDASLGGRRSGLVVFRLGADAEPLVDYLVSRRATW